METVLKTTNICKSFPGVKALEDISFELHKGEVHALLGENGAGKSTLIKILAGIYRSDSGAIEVKGKIRDLRSVKDSQELGISVIHQELNLAPDMTVAENIFMGREILFKVPMVNIKTMHKKADELLRSLNTDFSVYSKVKNLSIANQQMVEIAKALSQNSNIIIMDEPTSSLTDKEVLILYSVIRKLKSRGVAVIYVSHRLEEIFEISDRITVLRDGKLIDVLETPKTSRDELVTKMVGRELTDYYSKVSYSTDEILLVVQGLNRKDILSNIDLNVKKGEVVGIAGLVGAGRTELARAICGIDNVDSGEVRVENIKCNIKNPTDAIDYGIAYVPEDRKKQGLFLDNTVRFNSTILVLSKFINRLKVDVAKEKNLTKKYMEDLKIKAFSDQQKVATLSGGNQQKVVLAKWLMADPKLLILDEPTRGIDVGSKSEIYSIIYRLAAQKKGIIVISSDLPELLNVCDRIIVMHIGKITGEFDRNDFAPENIMHCATGGNNHEK